jgi:VanZ family protein
MKSLSRRLGRIAFYLASALVGALSLAPSATLPPTTIGDKTEHVITYAALAVLGGATSERGILRTILGLAAFGIALEFLQALSPGRSPDALDALADIIGACLGGGAVMAVRRVTRIPMFGAGPVSALSKGGSAEPSRGRSRDTACSRR